MNYFTDYASPVGMLRIVENGRGITAIKYVRNEHVLPAGACKKETPLLKQAVTELKEYFAGRRRHFDLPLDEQGTDFQKRVWATLREIPPCHRVIGADGTLTGYGGGLDIKKKLLELEASTVVQKDRYL